MKDLTEYLRGVKNRIEKAVPAPWARTSYTNYTGYSVSADSYGCIAERWSPGQDERIDWSATGELIASAPSDLATLTEICETLMGAVEHCAIQRSDLPCFEHARQAKVRVEKILRGEK